MASDPGAPVKPEPTYSAADVLAVEEMLIEEAAVVREEDWGDEKFVAWPSWHVD